MLRYLLIISVMILLYVPAKSQDSCKMFVKLSLLESHTKEPLTDVLLYIIETRQNAQTDENGNVFLDNICPGKYHIHIHSYETADTTLLVIIEKSGNYKLLINHSEQLLHLVEVHDKSVKTILQQKEVLDINQLRENSGKSISEQLKNINGVNTLSNGGTISKPVIHGLHSNRILMLNNGIRQEDQQWGSEHAPNIDPFIANQITVLKGAAGVRYGTDAIGGVILVEPAPVRSENGWGGELNLGAFSNNKMGVISGTIEHRFAKIPAISFRLQASGKQGGNYRIPGYWVANTGIQERNFSGTIAYQKPHSGAEVFFSRFDNTIGIYSGSHTGSEQDLKNAVNSDKPLIASGFTYKIERPRQEVSHQLLRIKGNLDNRLGVWTMLYAFQNNFRQEYDVLRVENGKPQLNLTLNTHSINFNLDHKRIRNLSGQIGIDGVYQHNTFNTGDRIFIPSYYAYSTAAYAIERYTKKAWTTEAGVRFDYKHFDLYNPEGTQLKNVRYLFDYKNPSATIAIKNKVNKRMEWNATLSNAWRAPQASELFSAGFHQGGARIEIGNKNLKPEASYSLNLGGKYQMEDKLNVDIALYTQFIQNFIFLSPGADVLTIRGYYKTFNYVQTNAQLTGTDLAISYSWNKHFNSNAQLSLLRARDRNRKDWLILMPSDRLSAGLKYKVDLNEKLKECFIGMQGQYVLRQTRIPANFDQIDYPRPPAAYFLLNAEAGLQFSLRRQPVFCSISASNLLNTKYRDYMDIFRYFIDQPGTNIALRLRVPFN